jgi:LuxR family transcriptional regulator, maltose regulon positive regulatory protein
MAIGTPPDREMERARGSDIAASRVAGLGAGRVVSRPALFARLGASERVTVVSAPAGSGKTLLLRSWIGQAGLSDRVAWVPAGRDERDPQRFWLTVLDALRGTVVGSRLVHGLTAAPDLDGWAILGRLLKDLAPLQDRLWLVIDDVHELGSDQALAQLELLTTSGPPELRLVLATRHDVRLRLHRLRLRGELTEIRATDLRFSLAETRELFSAAGVELPEPALGMLHERAEGWAAGLRLAAISLNGHPDPERFVAEFSGSERTVAEYLVAEMLERQPAEVQDLLLRTSPLDRVNSELADVLTGRPGSERVLLGLEDANAFVVSLDHDRAWFRYHRLFADLLRLELRRRLPEEVPVLHRRAAEWFIEQGQVADAIQHTQAADDWPGAARLLSDYSFSLTLDGQTQTMQALLRAFPPGEEHSELALVHATIDLVQGRLDGAASYLQAAETHAGTVPPDRQRRLRVAIASQKLSLARRRGHLAGVTEQVRFLASPVTAQSDEDIALGSDLRAVALMNLGTVEAWSGLPDAERHLQEGAVLAREIGRPYLEVSCLAQLGFASKIHSFATTQRRCREAIALADRHGWGAEPVVAPALVTLAGALIWNGDFDEGGRWLRRAAHALQTDTGPDITLLLHQTTGILHACLGRHHEALEEFSKAEHLRSQLEGSHALASQVTGFMVATQARLGLTGEARACLAALADERANSGEIGNARAVICLAQGDPAGALAAVQDVLGGTAPVIGYVTVAEAHLLAGLAYRELGDACAASQAAEGALALAEPDRLVLPFAMTGSRELLESLPRHQTAHAGLLTDILDVLRGASPAATDGSSSPPAEELSPGELRVLRYLATNLSRPEIASELSVSPNTVSAHIRSIYAKLQVRDRSSAVQRARELQLLAAGRTR